MHAITPLDPSPLDPSLRAPLSVLLFSIDGDSGIPDELLFEVLLFDRQPESRVWRQGDRIAALRAGDELDAVLWAARIRERLQEHGLRLSAGVASTDGSSGAARLLAEAEAALDHVRRHGGDMVLAHSTTVAVAAARR